MSRKALTLKVLSLSVVAMVAATSSAFAQTPARYTNYGYYGAARPVYASPTTTYAPNYYAGSPCGQRTVNHCSCCDHGCDPCGANYAAASPCAPACGPQVGYSPVVANPYGPQVRRGLLGQPVLYVPGQPVRNVLRFLAP